MFLISCKCGQSSKNFKVDIGTNFFDECCLKAGFSEISEQVQEIKESPKPLNLEEKSLKQIREILDSLNIQYSKNAGKNILIATYNKIYG